MSNVEITIDIIFFCLRSVFTIFYTGSFQVSTEKNQPQLKIQFPPKIPIDLSPSYLNFLKHGSPPSTHTHTHTHTQTHTHTHTHTHAHMHIHYLGRTMHKCTNDHILYCLWDMAQDTCNCYFSFWATFCPFTPLTAQKIKIWKKKKKKKKAPGDIIILHKCTKYHDHMLYCS